MMKASVIWLIALFMAAPSGPVEAGEDSVRIVPQFSWAREGRISPDKRFGASIIRRSVVTVVDMSNECLAWNIPLPGASDIAFSPDGKRLAACGYSEGFVLTLSDDSFEYSKNLRGGCISFCPDSKSILVANARQAFQRKALELSVVSLSGEVLRSYPLEMTVPEIIEPSPDGTSVKITGMDGDTMKHVRRMCATEQTIDIKTGKSKTTKGPVVRGGPRDRRKPLLHTLPDPGRMPSIPKYRFIGHYWQEATGIWVLRYGATLWAWDVRKGKCLGMYDDIDDIGGFIRPGVLIANAWHEGRKLMSLIDLREGNIIPTAISGAQFVPSPDGKCVLVTVTDQAGQTRLELWKVDGTKPRSAVTGVDGRSRRMWSKDGDCVLSFLCKDSGEVRIDCQYVRDRRIERFSVSLPEGWRVWSVDMDSKFYKLALGVGNAKDGQVFIVSTKAQEIIRELDGFTIWVSDVLFVDDSRILVGDRRGLVELWDYRADKILWATNTGDRIVQFGYIPGAKFLVCQHLYRSSTILSMKDGAVLRRTPRLMGSDSSTKRIPTNPYLISDGSLSLEVRRDSIQTDLVRTDSGECLLTFCPMRDDQWIVYTPQGSWDGSMNIHDYVKFFQGSKLLSAKEMERFRNRDKIDAVLQSAFGR